MSKIMVVEDDIDLRSSLLEILDLEGFETFAAGSAQEAVSLLERGADPDVILSDYQMKNGTGKDLLLHVRQQSRERPVFFLITGQSDVRPAEAKALGAQEFIYKPFEIERLLADLHRYLGSAGAA